MNKCRVDLPATSDSTSIVKPELSEFAMKETILENVTSLLELSELTKDIPEKTLIM
jgi:hypothetical protein